jgi:hypothetical protein
MRLLIPASLAILFCVGQVHAMGQGDPGGGKGRTKIDFKFDTATPTNSRLFAKIDVAAAVSLLANTGAKSHNDDLAGYTLTLTIGSAQFSAVLDEKGKSTEDLNATTPVPFSAKLTANGKVLQIKADGLNLQSLLGVDVTQKNGQVTVEVDVSISKTDPVTNVTTTTSLSQQSVTFHYKVHGTSVKGKNF